MKLLVIDVQTAIYTPELFHYHVFTETLKMLLETARQTGMEVLYLRHNDGAGAPLSPGHPGFAIAAPFASEKGERVFDKTVNSPFRSSGLLQYLRTCRETELIVTGLQTEYCVDAAVKCGFEHGFRMIVPAYANTTLDNPHLTAEQTYRYYNEFIWNRRYAECIPAGETVVRMEQT